MLKRLLEYFLIIVFVLSFIITIAGVGWRGKNNPSGEFKPKQVGIGIVMMAFPFLFHFREERKRKKLAAIDIAKLKRNSHRLKVDLKKCEVVHGFWMDGVPRLNTISAKFQLGIGTWKYWISTFNRKLRDGRDGTPLVILICPYIFKNKKRIFIGHSFCDMTQTIGMIERFESATVYIDRDDPSLYYFDLGFMQKV